MREHYDIQKVFDDIFPPEYSRRLICMFRAFVDASQPKDQSIICAAGFVGELDRWSKVQHAWREVRRKSGIEYFHMTDFMSRRAKPYRDWTEKKRQAVIGRLTSLVNNHLLFGVAVVVNIVDFAKLIEDQQLRCGNNAYALCATQCIGLASSEMKKRGVDERILWVFHAGDKGQPWFTETMGSFCTHLEVARRVLGVFSVMPGTQDEFPGLDFADFLAWQTVQHALRMPGHERIPRTGYLELIQCDIYNRYMRGDDPKDWGSSLAPEQEKEIMSVFEKRRRRLSSS